MGAFENSTVINLVILHCLEYRRSGLLGASAWLTWGKKVILAYCRYYFFCFHYKIIFDMDN